MFGNCTNRGKFMSHTNFHFKWSLKPLSKYFAPGTGNEMSDRNGFIFFCLLEGRRANITAEFIQLKKKCS